MIGLTDALRGMGSFDEAATLAREASESARETVGGEHELFVSASFRLGEVYGNLGQVEQAEELLLIWASSVHWSAESGSPLR